MAWLLRAASPLAAISFSARRMHDSARTLHDAVGQGAITSAGPPELAYIFGEAAPAANRVSFLAFAAGCARRSAGPAFSGALGRHHLIHQLLDREQRQLAGHALFRSIA